MDSARSMGTPYPWSEEEIRRVGHRVVDVLARYLCELDAQPVFRPVPEELARHFASEPFPSEASSADALIDEFVKRVAPYPFGNGHPRFYGWVNSPPGIIGVFAEALAAAMNPSFAGGNQASNHLQPAVRRCLSPLSAI